MPLYKVRIKHKTSKNFKTRIIIAKYSQEIIKDYTDHDIKWIKQITPGEPTGKEILITRIG